MDTSTGALVWAKNWNSIHARPFLSFRNRHLYVADTLGTVHALNIDDATDPGKEDWSLYVSTLAAGLSIEQNIWGEFRAPYQDLLFVTDSAGVLHTLWDHRVGAGGAAPRHQELPPKATVGSEAPDCPIGLRRPKDVTTGLSER